MDSFAGDEIISDAAMVYDHKILIRATPHNIFPWIVQLGKGRGGWYMPAILEQFLPRGWPASRSIQPRWQTLAVGDRVPDYGFSADDYFDVVSLEPPKCLVYKSERYGTVFTWALLLHEAPADTSGRGLGQQSRVETTVHLRFRGRIQSTGWRRKIIVWAGGWMDYLTTAPMLRGLKERVEKPHLT
ncbi:hypothetical protein B0A52_04841 [Exophiala mesophila]|uniref:Uncharacterized protein n=1 Tax=Exophiala mesophila TaxID=212818 RepID=A0A438N696_EXOME|nr:hypothetical protein B0A52_04841 [Exophiala mesophila]